MSFLRLTEEPLDSDPLIRVFSFFFSVHCAVFLSFPLYPFFSLFQIYNNDNTGASLLSSPILLRLILGLYSSESAA